MTLQVLKEVSRNSFAHSAYRLIDDEPTIVGKWCRCTYLDHGLWDVWLCNPENIAAGLTVRKVRSIHAQITQNSRGPGPFRELTGEGVYLGMPTDVLILNRIVLGIPKRRAVSPHSGVKFSAAAGAI